jgi:putative metallohydrolase (TIGR04338 family)
MSRDSHRSAVYSVEDALGRMLERGGSVDFFGSTLTLPVERRFADVASMQRYVDIVLSVVDEALPEVRVRERASAHKAHYEHARGDQPAVIAVPLVLINGRRWAARESVLLHEVAHHVTHHDPRASGEAAHGPSFCAHLITLHARVIGPESALLLRASCDSAGIPVAPWHFDPNPTTPTTTSPRSSVKSGCHQGRNGADGNPKSLVSRGVGKGGVMG